MWPKFDAHFAKNFGHSTVDNSSSLPIANSANVGQQCEWKWKWRLEDNLDGGHWLVGIWGSAQSRQNQLSINNHRYVITPELSELGNIRCGEACNYRCCFSASLQP